MRLVEVNQTHTICLYSLQVHALWPFALVAAAGVLLFAHTAATTGRRQRIGCSAAVGALRRVLELQILVSYVVLPSVSRSIFETWACESFRLDDAAGTSVPYLRSDGTTTCNSADHRRLAALSFAFLALWPIGVPCAYALLLWRCRAEIRTGRPSWLASSARFLSEDYSHKFLWWEVLDMTRKLLLSSWVLFIDVEEGYHKLLRLLLGSLVCLFFLTLLLVARPWARTVDNLLAACGQRRCCAAALPARSAPSCARTQSRATPTRATRWSASTARSRQRW